MNRRPCLLAAATTLLCAACMIDVEPGPGDHEGAGGGGDDASAAPRDAGPSDAPVARDAGGGGAVRDAGASMPDPSRDAGTPGPDGGSGGDAGSADDALAANPSRLALPELGGAAQGITLGGGQPPYTVSGCGDLVRTEVSGTMLLVAPRAPGMCSLTVSDSTSPTPQKASLEVSIASKSPILAPTPPMGWNSWNRFGCNVSESLIKGIADAMVSSGMKEAGYQYVNIDDCWQVSRDSSGTIVADAARFPSGIAGLASYVHGLGLKLGVYSDRGTKTCAGRPGSEGYETRDAATYAAWGVDYLKHDNCNATKDQRTQYQAMRDALRASGRDIVFSICAWRFASWMPETGELWRTTGDINDSWGSVSGIIDTNAGLASHAKPGRWNDPDMLEVGNGRMTTTEYRAHFSLWALMAAPLIAGNDLRSMSSETKAILNASEVIQVNQDLLGRQGVRVRDDGDREVWSKVQSGVGRRVVALFNRGASAADISVSWSEIGLDAGPAAVRDLWARSDLGRVTAKYTAKVPSHGVVLLQVTGKEKSSR